MFCIALVLAALPVTAADKVALRAANGRFLRAADDGTLHADSLIVAEKETFELDSRGKHDVVLKGPGGRCLAADPHDRHTPRLIVAGAVPASSDILQLLPAAAGHFTLSAEGSNAHLFFTPAPQHVAGTQPPNNSPPREMVEIYRIRELPAMLDAAVPATLRALATEELAGKRYDKTQKHVTEKYLDLPAPTLKDLKRTKRRQVLGITEEYRIQAELDGQPDIHIPTMSFLANYADGGPGVILLSVDASLPVRGRIEGKLVNVASVSTGYRITVQLAAVAEVPVRHAANDVTFGPPEVTDLHVSVARMEFSNDLLEAVRRAIRRIANRELAHNAEHIRGSANRAVQKAMSSRQVRIPLLGYLQLM